MTKTEIKLRVQIQHYLNKAKEYQERLEILIENPVIDWVREADNIHREWVPAKKLHENFLDFMDIGDDIVSKPYFGRLLNRSGLFKKRNGPKGREWKYIG